MKEKKNFTIIFILLGIVFIGAVLIGSGIANKESDDMMSNVLQSAQTGY